MTAIEGLQNRTRPPLTVAERDAIAVELRDQLDADIVEVGVSVQCCYDERRFAVSWRRPDHPVAGRGHGTHTAWVRDDGSAMLLWGHYELTDAEAASDRLTR